MKASRRCNLWPCESPATNEVRAATGYRGEERAMGKGHSRRPEGGRGGEAFAMQGVELHTDKVSVMAKLYNC